MPNERRPEDENLKALERLRSPSASPPRSPATPSPAPRVDDPFPTITPPRPAPPAPPKPRGRRGSPALSGPPRYRCLQCGYLLSDTTAERCSECGWELDPEALSDWYMGDEEGRFARVQWFILACLFVQLLSLLPPVAWLARALAAFLAGGAGLVARAHKENTLGSYYGIAATVAGAALLFLSGAPNLLAYYTVSAIAGCLTLMAMLHGPDGVPLGMARTNRLIATAALFATPIFAVGCYALEEASATGSWGSVLPQPYTPFSFIAPFILAAGVWVFAWRTLAGVQRNLFGRQHEVL